MITPIADFLRRYASSGTARFHMPGHKGRAFLGCEEWDITEITGADSLYEAQGIIAQSEECAGSLFGSARTLYSTEGSSQCIRAMLYLALCCRPAGAAPVILAGRNAHKAFIYAAAALDFEISWLRGGESCSLCSCAVSPGMLEEALRAMQRPPAAVYLTSPDYLGGMAELSALAAVCRRHGVLLAVDNAHGAYLHFLERPLHPLDCGADICCDSAHKTLPVLTGGAYLHINKSASAAFCENARAALALFGSTSPSYLTLASLDLCNQYLSGDYRRRLAETIARLAAVRAALRENGWRVIDGDPLRVTLCAPGRGKMLARALRAHGGECEYADRDFLTLMLTPENQPDDFTLMINALGKNDAPTPPLPPLPAPAAQRVCSVREALFAPHTAVPVSRALGRVCGAPTVSCPPAIPIVVSGERIDAQAIELLRYYQIDTVDVLLE